MKTAMKKVVKRYQSEDEFIVAEHEGMWDADCPECGCGATVEPDADYVYTCEGCGVQVKVVPYL